MKRTQKPLSLPRALHFVPVGSQYEIRWNCLALSTDLLNGWHLSSPMFPETVIITAYQFCLAVQPLKLKCGKRAMVTFA